MDYTSLLKSHLKRSTDLISPELLEKIEEFCSKFRVGDVSCRIPFGKYKGMKLSELWLFDKKYVRWIYSQEYIKDLYNKLWLESQFLCED
jgi:hypothetical protein